MEYCYFNGKITDIKNAKISPFDIGILRGYAVFDVMRTTNNKPFLLKEHFVRLKISTAELKLKMPFNQTEFEKNIVRLLKLNKIKKAVSIRTVITGGISEDAFSISQKPTSYIVVEKFHSFPEECYQNGAKLMVIENSLRVPQAKATLNYKEAIKFQDERKRKRAHEILYIKNGKVLECSTSSIFVVKNGVVITPKDKVLNGTTRNLMIKLAKDKFKIEEREVGEKELYAADEVFFAATNKGVVPVVKIENKEIADGKIGPITRELMGMYEEFVRNY